MTSDGSEAPAVKPPFSMRQNPEKVEEFYALREGIPEGLVSSLTGWVVTMYSDNGVMDRTRVSYLERITDRQIFEDNEDHSLDYLLDILYDDDGFAINATDIALQWSDDDTARTLEGYLLEARSAYCVGRVEDNRYELQFRQTRELSDLMAKEAGRSDRASEHLRHAWSKCFGLSPDLNVACIDAVKAIEVAAVRTVIPNEPMPTLGKMCSAIRDKSEKWETDSEFDGSVETILGMMDMVWKGHHRHGDESAPFEMSQEAAEMTVQTAVLLVSWFRSERIRLRSHVS